MSRRPRSSLLRPMLGWTAAAAVLAAVFALYLQPGFVFALASQVWACF